MQGAIIKKACVLFGGYDGKSVPLFFPFDEEKQSIINNKHEDVMRQNMNKEEMKEMAHDARRALERERERMMEEVERVNGVLEMMDAADEFKRTLSEMGFNIKNNYGSNIEVNEGGNVTLYQDTKGML